LFSGETFEPEPPNPKIGKFVCIFGKWNKCTFGITEWFFRHELRNSNVHLHDWQAEILDAFSTFRRTLSLESEILRRGTLGRDLASALPCVYIITYTSFVQYASITCSYFSQPNIFAPWKIYDTWSRGRNAVYCRCSVSDIQKREGWKQLNI